MTIKVMRAANYDPKKIKFPVWAEPKIDGVRGVNNDGQLTARTLKRFKNVFTTGFYSRSEYAGLDGELAANDEKHPDLCRLTTSALTTIEGTPFTLWHIFDYVTEFSRKLPYRERYNLMRNYVQSLKANGQGGHLRIVPYIECKDFDHLMVVHHSYVEQGYEGTCFYGPDVAHKEGKSSPTHNGVLRIKDFVDTEAIVLSIAEGETNLNEAQINELGRTYRTSHKENKVPNGMVGSMTCKALEDVFDFSGKKLALAKDEIFTVAPGKMTEEEKKHFFKHPDQLINKIIKVKFFPHGVKDKPRFANYQMIRPLEDVFD